MISLKVDHREGKLKELLDEHKVEVVYENLEYGDIQLLSQGEVVFVMERKTIDDLMASIKDGRYKNQKARSLQAFKQSQLYYIIEGRLSFNASSNVSNKIIQSAVINTMIRDKIACFHTTSLAETYELVVGIFNRMKEDPDKYLSGVTAAEQTVVTTSNKSTPEQVFKAMLCQIPGLSDKSAAVVSARWSSWKAMYEELKDKTATQQLDTLGELKMSGRKLGKRTIDGILKQIL